MTTSISAAILARDAEWDDVERYLTANRDRTCGECAEWRGCPCGCDWGICPNEEEHVSKHDHAVRDYECMDFNERKE